MDDYNNSKYDILEGKEKCKNEMEACITCERTMHQKAKVSLPISIEPFVVSGKIKARCCGDPKVSIDCKDNCSYVITQEICIEIPLKFGVSTEINEEYVECEEPYIEDTCND
ncbi:MAG: hypothetical protein K0S01_2052 [Herbinix sp.]|jgi:hypothetical protein|nr:hypothetical protein [Herbinix sp.]